MRGWLAFVTALFLASATYGQVQQSGTVTPNRPAMWIFNNVLGDAGPPTNGLLSGVGITNNSLTGYCQNTHLISSPYVEFCWGVTDSQAQISLQGYGLSTPGLQLCINAMCTTLPQPSGQSGAVTNRLVTSGVTDVALTSDGIIGWDSSSAGTKTESLYACGSGTAGLNPTVVDVYGSASGSAPVNITPSIGDTINGQSNLFISLPHGGYHIDCLGNHVWIVIGSF